MWRGGRIIYLIILFGLLLVWFGRQWARGESGDFIPISGVDTTGATAANFSASDLAKLASSDDKRIQSNVSWPQNGAYDSTRYLEFVFAPKLDTAAIVDKVLITHEFRRSGTLTAAKLLFGDGTNWPVEKSVVTGATTNTDYSETYDITSDFNTADKLNNLHIRFLAYRSTVTASGTTTSHDLIKLNISYTLPTATPTAAVTPLPTATPSQIPAPTPTPTVSVSTTPEPTPTPSETATVTPSATPTPQSTATPTPGQIIPTVTTTTTPEPTVSTTPSSTSVVIFSGSGATVTVTPTPTLVASSTPTPSPSLVTLNSGDNFVSTIWSAVATTTPAEISISPVVTASPDQPTPSALVRKILVGGENNEDKLTGWPRPLGAATRSPLPTFLHISVGWLKLTSILAGLGACLFMIL